MSRPQSRYAGNTEHEGGYVPSETRKPFKVVLEDVLQPKKKIKTMITYHSEAPAGYTNVAYGNNGIAAQCLRVCKNQGLDVYEVHVSPIHGKKDDNHVAHHLLRTGYHFPSEVVAAEVIRYNSELEHGHVDGKAGPISRATQKHDKHPKKRHFNHNPSEQEDIEEDNLTRNIVVEIFPRIPKVDLEHIVSQSRKMGTVGTAKDLPRARRVQLAVGARIRHAHTHYDQALKVASWVQARRAVEADVRAKIIEWRGEEDDGEELVELEETFREVIYLDDEDEEDAKHDAVELTNHDANEAESEGVNGDNDPHMSRSHASRTTSWGPGVQVLEIRSSSPELPPSAHSGPLRHRLPPRPPLPTNIASQVRDRYYQQPQARRVQRDARNVRATVYGNAEHDPDQPMAPWHPENYAVELARLRSAPEQDSRPLYNVPQHAYKEEIGIDPHLRYPLEEHHVLREQTNTMQSRQPTHHAPPETIYQSIEGPAARESSIKRYGATEAQDDDCFIYEPATANPRVHR